MKRMKIEWMVILGLVLLSALSTVYAQDADAPGFRVSEVITDEKVTLSMINIPAEMQYKVYMADADNEGDYVLVSKFNSGEKGGNITVRVKITEQFRGLNNILLRLTPAEGESMDGAFTNIPAEEDPENMPELAPEVTVMEVIPGVSVDVLCQNFPTDLSYQMGMTDYNNAGAESCDLGIYTPEEGSSFELTLEIPEALKDTAAIQLSFTGENGFFANNWFENAAEEAVEEPVAEEDAEEPVAEEDAEEPVAEEDAEEPVAEEDADEPAVDEPIEEAVEEQPAPVVCDYSRIPNVTIDGVVRNESVTFTTNNFPAEKTFSVVMGVYKQEAPQQPVHDRPEESWSLPKGGYVVPHSSDGFYLLPGAYEEMMSPEPQRPEPRHGGSVFTGADAGSFETGDGSAQTLTFDIPESLAGYGTITLWIQDMGECGFYAYNYFYNNTTY